MPAPPPRLSTVLDRSLFVTPPPAIYEDDSVTDITLARDNSMEIDELTSPPVVVEPYPSRRTGPKNAFPDLPTLRRLEGVYDRILMATSGVKRLGRGYQSDNLGPVGNAPAPNAIRRPMPPPVSSVEKKRIASVDELGTLSYRRGARHDKDAGSNTVTLVRRAFKAIVAGRPAPPRRPC
jgi:serine/threonine-protein kinase GIN4